MADHRTPPAWKALFIHTGLLCVCAGLLLPFAWMVSTSLKTLPKTTETPPRFVPHPWQPENYAKIFTHPNFHALLYTRNTLLIAALTVLGTTISSAIAAYGFARITFRGRNVLFATMLATIMIPFPITMVSVFRIFRWMDLHTIHWLGGKRKCLANAGAHSSSLWLPAWFGSAFSIFLLRQFLMTIPNELSEAARIDGCTEFGIFLRIILPLARPALAVVALFSFLNVWNDSISAPGLHPRRPTQYTLAL